ncbi:MAG: polyribonucleotide nucleotidyltransferase [Candidatus Shapirobacteria bacterium]|nr:polyribonucleotide nucleotidyltransferase [Candidatus Shapirobacteria bacterium]MDD5073683.1 polyribonucleotide nucleotidyltransferase [Candidatus Shapirobacteria bacterium]MDD5481445.1 polyribonucleotide nucleotidyltransferase [Candidatus Shapirobacteria bacterium]
MTKVIKKEIDFGGRLLSLEVGRFAPQADMAVLASYGETCVLATVVTGKVKPELGYFPLTVDYLEKLYAGGRIKGSRWVKREGRPSDEAVLAGRLIDRSIRPFFPEDYFNETHIVITVLSVDGQNDPVLLGAIASFAALAFSPAPWEGPLGIVSVGQDEKGQFILNPSTEEKEKSPLDLVVAGTAQRAVMIEAEGNQVEEKTVDLAIDFALEANGRLIEFIVDMAQEAGKDKVSFAPANNKDLEKEVTTFVSKDLAAIFDKKGDVLDHFALIKETTLDHFSREDRDQVDKIVEKLFKKAMKKRLLQGLRPDGRKTDEVRPISAEIGLLPRTHGSALFKRGQTHVLNIATLGPLSLGQMIESPEGEEEKRYIHHYSMPPFTVGEAGFMRGPGRREIGHGALAEKALLPVIPSEEKFPYTILLVSEVMSSNGSTSMASVCASSLSLMDAGVPISDAVAGIAVGIVTDKKGDKENYQLLTDIAGVEDFNGEMDFKVAGTNKGITAIQLDVKNRGLTSLMVTETLAAAKKARGEILAVMSKVISKPHDNLSSWAPKVAMITVDKEKIGEIIGPGGRMIKQISQQTDCEINVEDDGKVSVIGHDQESIKKAVDWIDGLVREVKIGEVFQGKVERIEPFGAFVNILPNRDGLVHISNMASGYVKDPNDIVSIGDKVTVRVIKIDERDRINLTMVLDETGDNSKSDSGSGRKDNRPNDRGRSSASGYARQEDRKKRTEFDRFSHFRKR